jgi:hypothetical protein
MLKDVEKLWDIEEQNTSCMTQLVQCNLFDSTCSIQLVHTTFSIQLVQYNLFSTTCSVQLVQYNLFNTTCSIQLVQYNLFNPTCSTQLVSYNTLFWASTPWFTSSSMKHKKVFDRRWFSLFVKDVFRFFWF